MLDMRRAYAEADYERDELGDGATLLESDQEPEEVPIRKRSRKAPEKALRMRANIGLEAGEYGGRRTTRAQAFGSGSEASDDSEAGLDGTGSEASEDSDAELDGSDAVSEGSDAELEGTADEASQTSDDSLLEDGDEESEREEGTENDSRGEAEEQGYEAMQMADVAALDQVKERIAREEAKGESTRKQQIMWDRLLELRILLQRSLTASRQLPRPEHLGNAKTVVEGAAEQLERVTQEAAASISGMLSLHAALVDQNRAIAAGQPEVAAENGSASGGKPEELWRRVEASYLQMAGFRDSSLDRWHRKTLVNSGAATLKGYMQMLNQSVSSQVSNMMRGSESIVARTQPLLAEAPRHLCSVPQEPIAEDSDSRDPETFDDSDFYQQLLKEFLEASAGGGLGVGVAVPIGASKKKKKNVRDRKASKGRRLRYDVQEKLVSFMAPKREEEPAMASQLFRNLFGHGRVV